MRMRWIAAVALALAWPLAAWSQDKEASLAPPVRINAGGKPIVVDSPGHSAPFYGDLCGDGKKHLLVGQFKDGLLRIYRNAGTAAEPKFEKFDLLLEGKAEGRVPTG